MNQPFDFEDDSPAPRREKKSGSTCGIILGGCGCLVLVAVLIICGGLLVNFTPKPAPSTPAADVDDDETPPAEAVGGFKTRQVEKGGKTVSVRGYYRKDGTWVEAHTRRPPK